MLLTQYVVSTAAPAASPHARVVERYRSVENPGDLAQVEYFDSANLQAEPAQAQARYVGAEVQDSGPASAQHRVLMIIAFCVPEPRAAEVERWYSEEHGPLLLRAPGWLRMRRYHVPSFSGGPRWTSLALHELTDVTVLDSAERKFARSTPWRAQLERESWFGQAGRWVYERITDHRGGE